MGPRVKFAVEDADMTALRTRLLTNDVKEGDSLQYMVFKLGNEAWVKTEEGPARPDLGEHLLKLCTAENAGKHLIFRSKDKTTDCWVKYIPDAAHVKEKTCFATASESLMDGAGLTCKHKLECRDPEELKATLSQFL